MANNTLLALLVTYVFYISISILTAIISYKIHSYKIHNSLYKSILFLNTTTNINKLTNTRLIELNKYYIDIQSKPLYISQHIIIGLLWPIIPIITAISFIVSLQEKTLNIK